MNIYDKVGKFGWYSMLEGTDRADYGNTWFVDSNGGGANNANTGNGSSWAAPFLTLNYAVSRCSNDAGDVIFVAANHAESWSTAETASGTTTTGCSIDKSGVTIIGLGTADRRPTFTMTAAAGTLDVRATEVTLSNLLFKSNFADTATLIIASSGGDGLIVEGCEFRDSSAITEYILGISIAANCNDTVIRGCRFLSTDTASATEAAVRYVGAHYRSTIQDCFFRGDWGGGSSDAVIDASTTASFDFLCDGNLINNMDPTYGACIQVHAGTTGVVSNNACYSTGVGSNPIVAAGCLKVGNTGIISVANEAVPSGVPRYTLKSTGNLAASGVSVALFTVTGDVLCRVGASVDVAVTSTSGTTTVEVGVAGNTACLCVQDAVDNTAFAIGDSWSLITAADTNGAQMADEWVLIGNGVDIVMTVSVNDITAGDMDFYCEWIPLSADGSVV